MQLKGQEGEKNKTVCVAIDSPSQPVPRFHNISSIFFCRKGPKHRAPIICSFTLEREPLLCRCYTLSLSFSLWDARAGSNGVHLFLMCYFSHRGVGQIVVYRGDTSCGWKVEQQDPVAGNTSLKHFEMSFRCAALS